MVESKILTSHRLYPAEWKLTANCTVIMIDDGNCWPTSATERSIDANGGSCSQLLLNSIDTISWENSQMELGIGLICHHYQPKDIYYSAKLFLIRCVDQQSTASNNRCP